MTAAVLAAVLAVVPVFGLILAGTLAHRTGVLGAQAGDSLNRFVVWLAVPALLFEVVATAAWRDLWQPGFIACFGIGGLVTMAVAIAVVMARRRCGLIDGALAGLNASYPNVGYMGFPVALALIGPSARLPATIAAVMTMCVFFAAAIILVEIGMGAGHGLRGAGAKVLKSLARNPLIVAPLLAVPVSLSGGGLPEPALALLRALGSAAAPCALVALGLFVAAGQRSAAEGPSDAGFLAACKLLLQPGLTWLLAAHVLRLDPALVRAAVLLAALPTGTGSFMIAQYHGRQASTSARVVVASTLLSILTLSVAWGLIA